jgi:hypothetical protein
MATKGNALLDTSTGLVLAAQLPTSLPADLYILSTTTGIDLTSVATTSLFTPSGHSAVVTGIIVRITAVNTFVTAGSISIGQNGSVNDIIPITALTGLNTTALFFPLTPAVVAALTISGNTISLKVTTGATATTLTGAVDLLGYLI